MMPVSDFMSILDIEWSSEFTFISSYRTKSEKSARYK